LHYKKYIESRNVETIASVHKKYYRSKYNLGDYTPGYVDYFIVMSPGSNIPENLQQLIYLKILKFLKPKEFGKRIRQLIVIELVDV
jgi:hypothetical protein